MRFAKTQRGSKMYKFETHFHTSECSACSVSTAKEMIYALKQKGYAGVVLTNHFYHGNTAINRRIPWKDFVSAYMENYLEAKKYGESIGMKVFFGIEEGYGGGKEFLIFGLSPDILIENPEFNNMEIEEKVDFIRKNGGITVCAHPFRDRFYISNPDIPPNPDLFDGIEVYNQFNRPEENQKAFEFAKKHGKIMTSGGDVHAAEDVGFSGIDFSVEINSYEDFIAALKNGDYKIIKNEN